MNPNIFCISPIFLIFFTFIKHEKTENKRLIDWNFGLLLLLLIYVISYLFFLFKFLTILLYLQLELTRKSFQSTNAGNIGEYATHVWKESEKRSSETTEKALETARVGTKSLIAIMDTVTTLIASLPGYNTALLNRTPTSLQNTFSQTKQYCLDFYKELSEVSC